MGTHRTEGAPEEAELEQTGIRQSVRILVAGIAQVLLGDTMETHDLQPFPSLSSSLSSHYSCTFKMLKGNVPLV